MADRELDYSIVIKAIDKTEKTFDELVEQFNNLNGNLTKLNKNIDEMGKKKEEVSKKTRSLSDNMAIAIGKIGVFAFAIEKSVKTLASFVDVLANDEYEMSKLQHIVELQGIEWNNYRILLDRVIKRTEDMTAYTDDDMVPALQRLTLMIGDAEEALDLLPLALDMASSGLWDLEQATRILSQLQEGNIEMLSRYIPEVRNLAEAYGETKDKTELVNAVTEILKEKFSGLAENELTTTKGKLKDLTNEIENLLDKMGESGLIDVLRIAISMFQSFVDIVNVVYDAITYALGYAIDWLIEKLGDSFLGKALGDLLLWLTDAKDGLSELRQKFEEMQSPVEEHKNQIENVNEVYKDWIYDVENITALIDNCTSALQKNDIQAVLYLGHLQSLVDQKKLFNDVLEETKNKAEDLLPVLEKTSLGFSKYATDTRKITLETINNLEDLKLWIETNTSGFLQSFLMFFADFKDNVIGRILDEIIQVTKNSYELLYLKTSNFLEKQLEETETAYDQAKVLAEEKYYAERDRILTQIEDEVERQRQLELLENAHNAEMLKIETDYAKKSEELKKKMEEEDRLRRQRMKPIYKAQAVMNTAASIMQTWAEPLPYWSKLALTALLALEGAQQVAIIEAQAFAEGVKNFKGGLAIVGEKGAELVELPQGTNVYSHQQTLSLAGANGITLNLDIHGNYILDESNARNLADIVSDVIFKKIKKERLI